MVLDHKPDREEMARLCPDVDPETLALHLASFPERYFTEFSILEICSHIREAGRLSDEEPYRLIIEPTEPEKHTGSSRGEPGRDSRGQPEATPGAAPDAAVTHLNVTVIAHDYLGEFSIITGLLSATGFNTISGDVYTSRASERTDGSDETGGTDEAGGTDDTAAGGKERSQSPRRQRQWKRRMRQLERGRKRARPARRIIDKFHGYITEDLDEWSTSIRSKLDRFMGLLNRNTPEAFTEARRRLHEEVAEALSRMHIPEAEYLYPVDIQVDNNGDPMTRMRIVSEDTPFFLYALSTAFALHRISIERVEIRTIGTQIEDQFDLVDARGRPITDRRRLDQLRLSITFTKQFTYFLGNSPDPYSALMRFEKLTQDFMQLTEKGQIENVLSSPTVLQDLARVLGASDFLWEDFIRVQYENLFPLLRPEEERTFLSMEPEKLDEALSTRLSGVTGIEERKKVLNDFKDHQTYLVDLDHILNPRLDFFFLSSRLTAVAETIVRHAVRVTWEEFSAKYGVPRTVAGIAAPYAIMGLGKLGGEALGYASDIELMFIYGDDGQTDGPEQISNAEFFQRLFHEAVQLIETKREGIFQVDLRLRPHGNAGPIATSLATFASYYSKEAMSFEKLALVRMRRTGGDDELGKQVERIRDDLIYSADSIDLAELQRLRRKQLEEKSAPDRLNAKFTPGGLVDLEYSVQILQVMLGRQNPSLRTPRIHKALEALVEVGEIDQEQATRLTQAYRFLRNLINGLRMLRGNARDLFLPPVDSLEYMHLARRAGYTAEGELTPAERLHMEFETRTAEVRAFVERELGREALPGDPLGTVADLILLDDISAERRDRILSDASFQETERAYRNIVTLAGTGSRRYLFAELAILAWDTLRTAPDPDMALNNWERFVRSLGEPEEHFRQLQLQPKRLEILLQLFSASQFLSDTLIRNPDFLEWVTSPRVVTRERTEKELYNDIVPEADGAVDHNEWLNRLRRFRKREILRIGTRDIGLGVPLEEIMTELSNLARALTRAVLYRMSATGEVALDGLAVLAFGKLGGRELNYSSDIDLLGIYRANAENDAQHGTPENGSFAGVMTRLREDLSSHTEEGYVYRVDFRLRPFGSAGDLVHSLRAILHYYEHSASLWEYQALLKLSPVAGDLELGEYFLRMVKPYFLRAWDRDNVVRTIRQLRQSAVRRTVTGGLRSGTNVKTGEGGIRDVEFLVQGLQMLHSRDYPDLLTGNTLEALALIRYYDILPAQSCRELRQDYLFLRRLEHFLQILQDRQVHSLPREPDAAAALARRMQRAEQLSEDFETVLERVRTRVRAHYDRFLQ